MPLPLAKETKFGIQTRLPTPDLTEKTVEMLDQLDFDSVWVGDHLAFTLPILDPFVQLAHACAYSRKLTVASGVYLLPMRHPAAAAKENAAARRRGRRWTSAERRRTARNRPSHSLRPMSVILFGFACV